MRYVCFTLAALYASLSLAAETPQTKSTEAKPAEAAQASAEVAVVPDPLHRHPTLLSMLRRSNGIRRRVGLRPQRMNPALTKAAQDHANYMAATGDFSHYTNGGYQYRAQKYGFRGGVRENIAYNYRSVDDAFNIWTASGGHYASIVSDTSEAGFGYAVSRGGATYWVGVYGSPAAGDPAGEDEGQAELEAKAKADAAKGDSKETPAKEAKPAEKAVEKPTTSVGL